MTTTPSTTTAWNKAKTAEARALLAQYPLTSFPPLKAREALAHLDLAVDLLRGAHAIITTVDSEDHGTHPRCCMCDFLEDWSTKP
jgi:hypothetical protein